MIVAGVGCRKGASGAQIETAIRAALAQADLTTIDLVAAPATKSSEPGIVAAASALGVPLVFVAQAGLEAAGPRTATRSERVLRMMNVPSAAEAAALAAGGPHARLIAPRT